MRWHLRIPLTSLALVLLVLPGLPEHAGAAQRPANDNADLEAALRESEAAVGRHLADYVFRDTNGQPKRLSAFDDRPVIINLIYTACTDFCPVTVQSLARAVIGARDALGPESFTVLTIGFDTRTDHPAQMRAYAKSQGIDLANWHFLSADAQTILAITGQLGFTLSRAPQGFDHIAQTTILGTDRQVFRQVYGADLTVASIVEPLKQIRYGQTANLARFDNIVERIKLFCTLYDPDEDAYRFDWSIFTGIIVGLLSISGLAAFLLHAALQYRNARRQGRPPHPSD
ncbi:MAG: SCO family protein [Rhodospirillales bacterium]|nr:MAG: SCO family protein [Rhodospirillales bacterium]